MYNKNELQYKNVVYTNITFTEETINNEIKQFLNHIGLYEILIQGPYFYSIENTNEETGELSGKLFLSLYDDRVVDFGEGYYFQSYYQVYNIIKYQCTLTNKTDLNVEYGRLVYESLKQNKKPVTPIYTMLMNIDNYVSAIIALGTN